MDEGLEEEAGLEDVRYEGLLESTEDEVENPFAEKEERQEDNEYHVEARQLHALVTHKRVWAVAKRLAMNIFTYITIATDVAFLGHLGDVPLAAAGPSFGFQISVAFIAYGMASMGIFTLISQAHGRSDKKGSSLVIQTSLLLSTIAWVPVAVLLFFTGEILGLNPYMDPSLLPIMQLIGRFSIPGVLFETWYRVVESALINQRIIMPCVLFQFFACVVNGFLNWLFIYGLDFGVAGSPVATSVTRLIKMLFAVSLVRFFPKFTGDTWPVWSSFSLSMVKNYLRHSVPATLAVCLEILGFEGTSFLAVSFGVLASSAHSAAFQMLVMCFFLNWGLTTMTNGLHVFWAFSLCLIGGAAVAVGNFLGAGEKETAIFYAKVGALLCGTTIACNMFIIGVFSHQLTSIFTSDAAVRLMTVALLVPFTMLTHLGDALNALCASLLRAVGRSTGSTAANLVGLFCFSLPLSIVLGFRVGLEVKGLWIALIAGTFVTLTINLVFLWRVNWDKAREDAQENIH